MDQPIPETVLEHFHDIADSLAFLDGTYGTTTDEITARRADQLCIVITDWCDLQAQDPAIALLLEARARLRTEAPSAPPTPTPRAAKPEPAVGSPKKGRAYRKQPPGEFACPDCSFVSTRIQGLSRHRTQTHGAKVAGNPATPEKIVVPNFDGHHRLAHEARTGQQITAWCACGTSSAVIIRQRHCTCFW